MLDVQSGEWDQVCCLPQCLQLPAELFGGHPPDWAMSDVWNCWRLVRTVGCGWGFEDLCHKGIHLNGRFSVCGGERGADSVPFSVERLWRELPCRDAKIQLGHCKLCRPMWLACCRWVRRSWPCDLSSLFHWTVIHHHRLYLSIYTLSDSSDVIEQGILLEILFSPQKTFLFFFLISLVSYSCVPVIVHSDCEWFLFLYLTKARVVKHCPIVWFVWPMSKLRWVQNCSYLIYSFSPEMTCSLVYLEKRICWLCANTACFYSIATQTSLCAVCHRNSCNREMYSWQQLVWAMLVQRCSEIVYISSVHTGVWQFECLPCSTMIVMVICVTMIMIVIFVSLCISDLT